MIRLQQLARSFQQLADFVIHGPRFPFPSSSIFALDCSLSSPLPLVTADCSPQSFLESLKDGFLWGVPKKRRSLEIRWRRKHGCSYMAKYKPKTDLIVCLHCGNFHEAHSICRYCYNKVKEETIAIQKQANIKARTADQHEVVVLYEGDIRDAELTEGKKIVEMPKPRPSWFHPGLMTKVLARRE